MNGKGSYNYYDGVIYNGQFKDGVATGKGVQIYRNMDKFEG